MTTLAPPGSKASICQLQRQFLQVCAGLAGYCTATPADRDTLAASLDDAIAQLAELVRILFYETREDREETIAVVAEQGGWRW